MSKRQKTNDGGNKRKLTRYDNDENIKLATWMVENPFREKKGVLSGGEKKKDWHRRMFSENGIEARSADSMSSKETFLRQKYRNAKKWAEQTGQGVLEADGEESFRDALIKMCPWFWILHQEMDQLQQYNPKYLNNGGDISEPNSIINDIATQRDQDQEISNFDDAENVDADEENYEEISNENLQIFNEVTRQPSPVELTTHAPIQVRNEPNSTTPTTDEQVSTKTSFSNSLRAARNKRPGNAMQETIASLYESRKKDKFNQQSENLTIENKKMDFEKEKWEWEKEQSREMWQWKKENAERKQKSKQDHEEKLMSMKLQELELKLKLKQAEIECKKLVN